MNNDWNMTGDMKPSERRHKKTKQTILDTALALVMEKGPDKLSLREVARRVDYSPSGLYEYFTNKEEIISALCTNGFDQLAKYLREVPIDLPLEQYLLELGLAYLKFAKENPQYYRLIFTFIPSERGSLEEPVDKDDPYAILLHAMVQGLENGDFTVSSEDHAESLSYSFWALLHGMAMLTLTVLKDFEADFETANRRAIEIFVRGLFAG